MMGANPRLISEYVIFSRDRGDRTHIGQFRFLPHISIPLGEMERFFLKTRGIVSLTPSNFFVVVALKLEKLQRFQFFGVFFLNWGYIGQAPVPG
jgi:hypothetical protein